MTTLGVGVDARSDDPSVSSGPNGGNVPAPTTDLCAVGSAAGRLSNSVEGFGPLEAEDHEDDFSRQVYCVQGVPIDIVDMAGVIRKIRAAAAESSTLFLSTPNLNYLVTSLEDADFRESLLLGDLCLADGMPIVWLGRLLGAPIKRRVAGSDILSSFSADAESHARVKLFLFGGAEGVAEKASRALNSSDSGVQCVGTLYPGFCSVDELSSDIIIDAVNSSSADFLVVALGAKKGQEWLTRNHNNLRIPVRAHLGATLNFEAGALKRAPRAFQRLGVEWLWRIKEEPYLWRRYWRDGRALMRLVFARVMPLLLYRLMTVKASKAPLTVVTERKSDCVKLRLVGAATARNTASLIPALRAALQTKSRVLLDLQGVCAIDARFLGLCLVLRKALSANNLELALTGVSSKLDAVLRMHGLDFLPKVDDSTPTAHAAFDLANPPLAPAG